jgi:hypothetical protein
MLLRIPLIFFVAAIFAAGCSDDKPTSVNPPGNTSTTIWNNAGFWETTDLSAASTENYTFYSFARRDTATLTLDQALSSDAWDVGLRRVSILINSGASGGGETEAMDLTAAGAVDTAGFVAFASISSVDTTHLAPGAYELIIDEWYSYNPVSHQFDLTRNVYIMSDATGGYVKFQIIGMENPGIPPNMGTISIQFIYSTDRNFNEAIDTLTFDATSGGPFYIDFSSGSVVNPTDPQNSTDWDLVIGNYEIHQNNTIFGPGDAGTYEVWLDQTDPTDFDETPAMPAGAPPFPDDFGSPLSDWYNYVHEPGGMPTVLSNGHIFLFRSGDSLYKLQIISYYNHDGGASGYYTFRWAELE